MKSFFRRISAFCVTLLFALSLFTCPALSADAPAASAPSWESIIESLPSKIYTGSKTATRYDSQGNIKWTLTLSATFEVKYGFTAKCVSAECTYKIADGSWKCISLPVEFSGNRAYVSSKFKKYILFFPVHTIELELDLTCGYYGVIE